MKKYKILAKGEGFKAEITAKKASKAAMQKMAKAGGKIILPEKALKGVPSAEGKEKSGDKVEETEEK